MSLTLIALVLFAALLHASWNALVKGGGDPLIVLSSVMCVPGLLCGLALPFIALPAAESWPFLAASVLLHGAYYFFLLHAYRVGDLSVVYPLARGTAPLLVALGAVVLAGEALGGLRLFGVLLASAGIISLAFERGLPWRHDMRAVTYALATSAFIAAYTLMDGMGVRASGAPASYILWLFFLDCIPLLAFVLWRRGSTAFTYFRSRWGALVAGGFASALAYALVIYAMSLGAMAMVAALRESSVLFAVLIGVFLLRERFTLVRFGAALMVVAGVVSMQLAY